ncbi:MAG: Rieske 2Fe-2S domain-containing protein [Verrucomicrobia bacterium]|nr:Rieske 2Fe-2S domain-containing protein [Verrucomicrobiota bacterium]
MAISGSTRDTSRALADFQSRRRFLKLFAAGTACAGGAFSDATVRVAQAAGAGSTVGVFRLRLDDFPALKADFGSVLLRVGGMPTSFPQIIVTRLANNEFAAVTSVCTHQGCTVGTYNKSLNLLVCLCHGSWFKATGEVRAGPALSPLSRYTAEFDGAGAVNIRIPGLGFSVKVATVPNTDRLRLSFPTVTGVRYDVRFRAALGVGDWQVVPFATAVDGALTQTTLNGNNTEVSVYVARTAATGFYSVTRS